MIATYIKAFWKSCKDFIITILRYWSCYTMIHLIKINQFTTKSFTYRLMSQTNTKHRLAPSIMLNNIKQQSSLRRNTWSWTKNNLVECFKLIQLKPIITIYGHFGAQLFYKMCKIICKRIIVINDNYLLADSLFYIGRSIYLIIIFTHKN